MRKQTIRESRHAGFLRNDDLIPIPSISHQEQSCNRDPEAGRPGDPYRPIDQDKLATPLPAYPAAVVNGPGEAGRKKVKKDIEYLSKY
jgi:hypothetical protein